MYYGNPYRRRLYSSPLTQNLPIDHPAQKHIAAEIVAEIDTGLCALIYGPPGTGKTMVATHVAAMLSAAGRAPVVVRGWSPSNLGDSVYEIFNKHTPTRDTPVIICLEEFDSQVAAILAGEVKRTEQFVVEATDKASLCGILDRLSNTPFLAVLATSNAGLAWWSAPEREFVTRPGRFAIRVELAALGASEAAAAFESGLRHYNLSGATPNFRGQTIKIAQLAEAFKRARGDVGRVYAALKPAAEARSDDV